MERRTTQLRLRCFLSCRRRHEYSLRRDGTVFPSSHDSDLENAYPAQSPIGWGILVRRLVSYSSVLVSLSLSLSAFEYNRTGADSIRPSQLLYRCCGSDILRPPRTKAGPSKPPSQPVLPGNSRIHLDAHRAQLLHRRSLSPNLRTSPRCQQEPREVDEEPAIIHVLEWPLQRLIASLVPLEQRAQERRLRQ